MHMAHRRNHDPSVQMQSPIADAGAALRQAEHAVAQYRAHPGSEQAQQAEAALQQTERAILTAESSSDNPLAVSELIASCSAIHDRFVQSTEEAEGQSSPS